MKSISYPFKLLSHRQPNKLLVEHLQNVGSLARRFVEEKRIKRGGHLGEVAYLMGIAHDFGKASVYFQDKLLHGEKSEKARHSLISALWGYYIVRRYLEEMELENDLPIQVYLAISRHHGDLRNIRGVSGEREYLKDSAELLRIQLEGIRKNYDEVREIYRQLCVDLCPGRSDAILEEFFSDFDSIMREVVREMGRLSKGNVSFYLRLLFLYSVLLDSDKTDASNSQIPVRLHVPPDAVDIHKAVKFKSSDGINRVREDVYREVMSFTDRFDPEKHRILVIELPTGSGKTLTGFSLALKMRSKIEKRLGMAPRIIYSLPFLSIIEQNSEIIRDVLRHATHMDRVPSNMLLVHHHLADIMYDTYEEEYDVSRSRILTEGWNSEVIITTFFQVFHSLITHRNSAVRKFHRFANSILILDEVQSIPHKYWKIVHDVLKTMSEEYNMWVILMTATMPMIFSREECVALVRDPDRYYKAFNRVVYNVWDTIDLSDLAERVWFIIERSNKDVFVILNKVSAVKRLYQDIRGRLGDGVIDDSGVFISEERNLKLVNLTTHILPKHRFDRIAEIRKRDDYRKVVISTQLVEAGVDISSRELFRDIAPMDSVFQSGGRCNRSYEYGALGGTVHITNVIMDGKPLWRNIYDSVLIDATKKILRLNMHFEEKMLREIMHSYYSTLIRITASDHSVEEAIERHNYGDLKNFRLIEENYPKEEVFVVIDDDAQIVLNKYLSLRDIIDPFERRDRFLQFKREFYNYVISAPEEVVRKLGLPAEGEVRVIYPENVRKTHDDVDIYYYDLETGIMSEDNLLIL